MLKRALSKFIADDEVIFIALFFIMVLPLFWLSQYNHPATDDYTEAIIGRKMGFWGAQEFWYYSWTGRYFWACIISLNPLVFGAYFGYKINAIVLLTLMLISTYFLMNQVTQKLGKQVKIILLTSFLFIHFLMMPDIAQGIFWQAHSYACYVGIILSILMLGCVLKFYRTNKKIYLIISCILCGGIIGSYEILMAITDLLSLLLVLYFLSKGSVNRPALAILITCIFFSCIEAIAPGNNVREGLLTNGHHFVFSVVNSIKYGGYYILLWLPVSAAIIVILYDYIAKKMAPSNPAISIFNINPIYPFIFCFCAPVIGFFAGFWPLGERPPMRAINVMHFYFLLSSFYFLLCLIYSGNKKYNFSVSAWGKITAYIVLLVLVFFKAGNLTNAYEDILTGNAKKFNEQMTIRYHLLMETREANCSIEAIKNTPKTVFFAELTKDTNDNGYKAFCIFYKKKHIAIK